MKTSDTGLAFISGLESFVDHVYHGKEDPPGVLTVYFGHVVKPGERFPQLPDRGTREEGLRVLGLDLAIAEAAVNGHVIVTLTQAEFDACVSMAFNCGGAAFAGSSLCHLLNSPSSAILAADCARAFLKWDKATIDGKLQVSAGLHNRRMAEAAMFLGVSVDEARAQLEPSPVAPFTGAVAVLPDVEPPDVDPAA